MYSAERFRVQLQAAVHNLMIEKGLSQKDLASRMGVSQARVSQMFASECNLTVRTLGAVLHALGCRPEVSLSDGVIRVVSDGAIKRTRKEAR